MPYLDENQNQQSTSPSKPAKSYTIAAGDTLSAISQRYGVSVSALAEANNIQNINQIYAGQKLIIPES
ncbi:LysM domain-containing protein [Bacillales bacterium AN1005]